MKSANKESIDKYKPQIIIHEENPKPKFLNNCLKKKPWKKKPEKRYY